MGKPIVESTSIVLSLPSQKKEGTDVANQAYLVETMFATNKNLPTLARHILGYLREHPEAQDTLEGVMVWWVSERAIKYWLPKARRSLAALVARGYVEKHTLADGRTSYRLNRLHERRGKSAQKRSKDPRR